MLMFIDGKLVSRDVDETLARAFIDSGITGKVQFFAEVELTKLGKEKNNEGTEMEVRGSNGRRSDGGIPQSRGRRGMGALPDPIGMRRSSDC